MCPPEVYIHDVDVFLRVSRERRTLKRSFTMTRLIENELSAMERSVSGVSMTDSQRLVAMAALRNGFMLVEVCARVAQAVKHGVAALFARPRLAR